MTVSCQCAKLAVRSVGNNLEFGRSIHILLHSDLRRTTRVRRFVDFLTEELMALKKDMQGELYGN